jgi:hypothetical protein
VSTPSFEKINYAFRPAKHAQRKMLCEALHRLGRLASLRTYRYVGFGSVGFHDFSLFHQRLGIDDMISIEASTRAKQRVSFNRPYACIRMKWGWSYDVLPTLSWPKRSIVWLDYEHSLDRKKLADISLVTSSLLSGSMLVVTLPVEPRHCDDAARSGPKHRLADLIGRVGEDRVPVEMIGPSLSGWGAAKVERDIVNDEIVRTLLDRNDPLVSAQRVEYQQLFNFRYDDGKRMMTVGGLLANAGDRQLLGDSFEGLEFVRRAKPAYTIETPMLTIRELRFLDALLPTDSGRSQPKWLPAQDRQRYSRLYRHFPTFGVVEP